MKIRAWICILILLSSTLCRADIHVTADDAVRELPPHFFGQNSSLVRNGTWRDARYTHALSRLYAGHVRFPAGTLANYWDWQSGWFKKGLKLPYGLSEAARNPYELSDLKVMHDKTGAVPAFVLNMLTSDLAEQLAMLRAARRIGLPVLYVELGNEFYLSKTDNMEAFPTAADYAETANEWAAAIRREFPNTKIAAVGTAVRSWDDERRKTWNETLFPLLSGVDAVVIHVYTGAELLKDIDTTLEAAGLVETARQQKDKPADDRPGYWAADAKQRLQLRRLHSDEGLIRMLGMPSQRWSQMNDLEHLPVGMEVWITEYGLFDRIGPARHTWANGLLIAAFSLQALEIPQITKATYHSTFNHPMFAAVYGQENAFGYLVESPLIAEQPFSQPFHRTPSGVALSLIGRASLGMDQAARLTFSENPELTDGYVDPYGSFYGMLFSGGDNRRALILNLCGETVGVDLSALFAGRLSVEQVTMKSPRAYGAREADYRRDVFCSPAKVNLKPYSITLID